MVNWPNSADTDATIPRVDDNIIDIGAEAINSLRDAVFAIEENLGLGLQGNTTDLATRLNVSIDANGNIKPSALASLALSPIVNAQISPTAAIQESKLALDHKTADLYNSIITNNGYLQTTLAYISGTGAKVEPHIAGTEYNHYTSAILIAPNSTSYFKNRNGSFRDNSNLYNLFNDFNKDLVSHEKADSTNFSLSDPTSPSVGTIPPANYAHVAAGIYLNPTNFSFVPQTTTDLQQFAEFVDNSNIFLLGTRIQTFYSNGISRTARSGALPNSTLGQLMVPSTSLTTYLLYGGSSSPVDDIDHGDDVVEFTPDASLVANSVFDSMFNLVRVGDILTTTYDGYNVSVQAIIKEKKLVIGGSKRYVLRLDRKNLMAGTTFHGTINKPLFNNNKFGVLALAQAESPMNVLPSLIAGHPRGAQVLGLGFNADQIDQSHYNLYLQLYSTGNPTDGVISLPAIDITGNKGKTPGQYTLRSIIETTNAAFRVVGYNYRFIAFDYQGQFGLMLADPYNNSSFSIISGILSSSGFYDNSLSVTTYPNNVIGVPGFDDKDALGLGPNNANLASPPYSPSFANATVAQTPTKLFVPLTRNNYYVNGVERERFDLEIGQSLDGYGDGYWPAQIVSKTVVPGVRVEVTYKINLDLSESNLLIGKTLVVKSSSVIDSGRFFIKNIQFNNCNLPTAYTQITVYDAIHSTGTSPYASAPVGTDVWIYFNGDSIGFNIENSTDYATASVPFKRLFEVYVDSNGHTFSHERGRMNISGTNTTINGVTLYGSTELSHFGIYDISTKLRGYDFFPISKINLQITSYSSNTGIFSGYLCSWDGSTITNQGPITIGKKGSITRFYDQTYIEYIDIILDSDEVLSNISSTKNIDIQLFPTLQLDEEIMLLGSVQVNDSTNSLFYLQDKREFGNISEEQLTTSALDFISSPTKYLSENGIIQGFELLSINNNNITFSGGSAIVDGKIIQLNKEIIGIPVIQETLVPYGQSITINTITWFVCLNNNGEIEFIASTDFDPKTSSSTYDLAGVDHTRIFYAINPNDISAQPYQIRASYLADIITNFKDVVILATISATVTLSGASYSITSTISNDARRFIYNGYGGLTQPFVFGNSASFRSFDSLNTWMKQLLSFKSSQYNLNNIGRKVIVKGNNTLTSSVTLDYGSEVIFEGDNGQFSISSIKNGFNIGSNVSFNNIIFDNEYDPILNSDPDYIDGYLSNNAHAFLFCNVDTINGNKNIKINNCKFVSAIQKRYPFMVFNFAGSGAMLENVSIQNNTFTTTFAGDDKLSVMSFIGPLVASTSTTGPRLINCDISNNYCNKNQLIQISSSRSNSGLIEDLLVSINVKINNNTCGAINVLTKQDTLLTSYNTTFSKDKNNDVSIFSNNCKFIYCGFGSGLVIDNISGDRLFLDSAIANGIFTGNLAIENNVVSFMHIGERIPTTYGTPLPTLIIKNNRFLAADTSISNGYLNSYYNGFTGFPYTTIGLIIDKESGL